MYLITACKRSLRRLCFYTCLSVILFTGGAYPIACWDTPPPGQAHPLGRYPPGRYPQVGTPPGRYTTSRYTPSQAGIPRAGAPTSAQCVLGYGQQAGGTHPTGMQSCWYKKIQPIALNILKNILHSLVSSSRSDMKTAQMVTIIWWTHPVQRTHISISSIWQMLKSMKWLARLLLWKRLVLMCTGSVEDTGGSESPFLYFFIFRFNSKNNSYSEMIDMGTK